jgi:hypothetical protein
VNLLSGVASWATDYVDRLQPSWALAQYVWATDNLRTAAILLGAAALVFLVLPGRGSAQTRPHVRTAADDDDVPRSTNTLLLRRLWWTIRPPHDLMHVDGLTIDRSRKPHAAWLGPTGAGKSSAVAAVRVNGQRPTLQAMPDISDPLRAATLRLNGFIWTACESSRTVNFLIGSPTEVAERLTEVFRSGGVGAWKRAARRATAEVIRELDAEDEPRTLKLIGERLKERVKSDRDLKTVCAGWVDRFLDLADQFGSSIGPDGVDIADLLNQGMTVLLDNDAFDHPSLGGDVVALGLAEAKRCASLVPGGYRLIFEEAGQLGDRIDLAEPFHRAGRRRKIAVDDLTQAESDLSEGISANIGTRFYFAQELKSLQRIAADRLGIDYRKLDPANMRDFTAWVAHGKIRRLVRFPKPRNGNGTVEPVRTPHLDVWKRANGNTARASHAALTGKPPYALPAPRRATAPGWIQGVRVRELIWELLDGTEYESGCWLWLGERHPKGYGRFRRVVDGVKWDLLVHRAMWEYANGAIVEGMTVDHQCEPVPTTRCGNPRHMALVPRDQNTRLRWERSRERTGGAKA